MTPSRIVLGVDFDNTIVHYDTLFYRVASELRVLAPGVAATKNAVRDHLNSTGRNAVFTEMQGTIYGTRMAEAEACPGAIETLTTLAKSGVTIYIISHKTRTPLVGAQHDMHAAARGWLELNGFFDSSRIGLTPAHVFFEPTKEAKIARIAECACTHFVDDLPEILLHPNFPDAVKRILYEPGNVVNPDGTCQHLKAWKDLPGLLSS